MIDTYLFPSTSEKKEQLMKEEFIEMMEKNTCNYIFIKSNEMRKKFTDYVYLHK